MTEPIPDRVQWPVEAKVKSGAAGAVVAGFALWLLQAYVFRGAVPAPVELLVMLAVPAALAFAGGYLAPHTPRPLVDALRRAGR